MNRRPKVNERVRVEARTDGRRYAHAMMYDGMTGTIAQFPYGIGGNEHGSEDAALVRFNGRAAESRGLISSVALAIRHLQAVTVEPIGAVAGRREVHQQQEV